MCQWLSTTTIEESATPMATTKSTFLTGVVEAKEGRQVITLDVPNTFIQMYLEDENEPGVAAHSLLI